MLLGIIARPNRRDKFEVNSESVALLTALVACSDEVRSRCHVKHTLPNPVEISDTLHLTHPHVSGQQDNLVLDTNYPSCRFHWQGARSHLTSWISPR